MIVGILVFDSDLEMGDVVLTEEFNKIPSLLKVDLMNDFSLEIDRLYEKVYDEYCRQYKARKEVGA